MMKLAVLVLLVGAVAASGVLLSSQRNIIPHHTLHGYGSGISARYFDKAETGLGLGLYGPSLGGLAYGNLGLGLGGRLGLGNDGLGLGYGGVGLGYGRLGLGEGRLGFADGRLGRLGLGYGRVLV